MKTLQPVDRRQDAAGARSGERLKVLIVDDEVNHAEAVRDALERVGYECVVATSGKEGLRKIDSDEFDIILTDLRLGDMSGLDLLRKARQEQRDAEVVVITGQGDVRTAVEAMQEGAANYLIKSGNLAELRTIVNKAVEKLRLERANRQLQQQINEKFGFEGIIGDSQGMHEVLNRVKAAAPTNVSVLIQGETGTGKELVAKAIHNNSPRKNKPFIEINCTASNENLLDDLLFGHVPGSYTGAEKARKGVFEEANGGTLFLDEIGDMPLPLQAKLLKVLEDQKVYRIGSNDPIHVNVRVLSATHRDLEAAVAAREFRQDLYFRLNVLKIKLPPLRERREDIPLLVDHFVREFSGSFGKEVREVAEPVMRALQDYRWEGNVRELRNLLQGMVLLDTDGVLNVDDLKAADADRRFQAAAPSAAGPGSLVGRPLAEIERFYIEKTLERTQGNREEAAKQLCIGERTLYRVIRDWELQDRIKAALEAAHGNVAEAAKSLGMTEKTLARKIKKLGLPATAEG
jgi:two-component system response regulator HydG